MRRKQPIRRLGALLRQGMALSVAVALVCSMALGAAALEVDVLNEDTGLIDTLELDDEYLVEDVFEEETPAEDEETAEDPDEETPEEDSEAADDTDEETPDETKEDSTEEKDIEEADDEEPTDEDYISTEMPDEEEGKGEIALLYARSQSVSEAYYYDSNLEDENVGSFYLDSTHDETKLLVPQGTTMQTFIDEYCASGAKIKLLTPYKVSSGTEETWNSSKQITVERPYGLSAVRVYGTLTLAGDLTLDVPTDSGVSTTVSMQGGTLNIKDNVVIKGCNNTSGMYGGVIYMSNGGTVNMHGGTLTGAKVGGEGGAVWMKSGQFNMYDGAISGNSAYGGGGGVYVETGGSFSMRGGKISGNESKNGGGVYINGGLFYMLDGTIGDEDDTDNRNTASSNGGGVYVAGGTFTLTQNAVIAGNTSVGDGAGFYLGTSNACGTLIMSGGKITKNEVTGTGLVYGGGIGGFGDFKMSGGIITENTSPYSSGVSKPGGKFEITGGTIDDNSKVPTGTNISIASGTGLKIDGGSVEGINYPSGTDIKNEKGQVLSQYIISDLKGSYQNLIVRYILDGELHEYDCGKDIYADSEGNVYPWLPKGSVLVSASAGTVPIPQISISVPVSMTVTINPAGGECEIGVGSSQEFTVGDGNQSDYNDYPVATYSASSNASTIQNNSAVPIYLTSVTFTWNTGKGITADNEETPAPSEIFTNWSETNGRPTIQLNEKPGTVNGNTITWSYTDLDNCKLAAKVDGTPGSLDLTWSFDLNGNSISQALNAGVAAPIGTIVYTVSYQNPDTTSSQSLEDEFYIYEYENGGDAA